MQPKQALISNLALYQYEVITTYMGKRDGSKQINLHCRNRTIESNLFPGAQPMADTGHKIQPVPVCFTTLRCVEYIADLRYIAGSLLSEVLAGSLESYPPF